jgi:uncharacterized LabA/DUF88 family protein
MYYNYTMNSVQHKEQRVGVFVDIQNMYYSAKNLYSSKVDFGKLLNTAVSGRKLIRAFAYVIKADVGSEREFFEALNKIGYEVREKELQIFYGGAKKGDWDVGLCMDAVRTMPKIDTMVLVSGDGDYTDLLDYARSQGLRTEVIAFGKTGSSRLFTEADLVTDMGLTPEKYLIGKPKFSIGRSSEEPKTANQANPVNPTNSVNSTNSINLTDQKVPESLM